VDPQPASPPPSAEELFADFLDRLESGENVDFDAFCRAYPAMTPALQRVHTRYQAMTRSFNWLSQERPAGDASVTAKSVDALKQRLGSPGGRLARYTLRQEIARGAMGRIVHAWDEELRRDVALKIHRGPIHDTRTQRRFLEEAQIAAQLDHPGIVPIHELGLDADGRPFFSMQLVRGRDLGQLLLAVHDRRDGWSRTRVLGVLLRVCEAMAFAHDKGVVHRDLKPANIMVGRFGETYVMDWGLAHVMRSGGDGDGAPAATRPVDTLASDIAAEDTDSALLTRPGDVLGTPAYMAPEQAAAGNHASPAIDVYAIGAILYHLLTGDIPYAAGTRSADDVLRALRAGPPRALPHDVPPELRAICERAMARDPARRYAGMVELADDLRAFLEVRTVRAYATGRFAELRKWIARNHTLTAVCGAFVLALAASAIAVTSLWVQADGDRQRADDSAGRLQTELDRAAFQGARQALQLDNSTQAADALWRTHFTGRMPRATAWALKELAERDPYLATLPLTSDSVPVAFGTRGDVVLVGGVDGRLQLRDPETLALRAELGDSGARLASVTALDDTHAVAGTTKGDVLVFDLGSRSVVHCSTPHTGNVACLAATRDGRFASGGSDGRVLWWQRPDAAPTVVLTLDARLVSLAIRPDADGVVAADSEGVFAGKALDGSWQFRRRIGGGYVTAIAFADTPTTLWLGSTDHQVRRIDLADASREWARPTRNGTCRQLVRDRDGSVLVGGWWRVDRMAADGSSFTPVALRGITRFALDPERRRLVTSSGKTGLGQIDLAPVDRRVLPGVGSVALSTDGRRFATSTGNRVTVLDVDHQTVVARMPTGDSGWLRLDDDGSHVAVVNPQTSHLQLYEVATGALLHSSDGPGDIVGEACQFALDGSELAFAAGTERVRRVRTHDGHVLAEYMAPGQRIIRATYSHDGRRLAVLARDQTFVRVFDLATGSHRDEEFAANLPDESKESLAAVALSCDGSRVAAGTWQGQILVREANGSTRNIPGHTGTVWSLQFAAADPGLLFSSGGAQGLACWDLDSGECCYQAIHDVASQMQVSRDGRTLACVLPTGALLLDLGYRDRHIAGNLAHQLDRLRRKTTIAPAREAELREWAGTVLALPWPRWR